MLKIYVIHINTLYIQNVIIEDSKKLLETYMTVHMYLHTIDE